MTVVVRKSAWAVLVPLFLLSLSGAQLREEPLNPKEIDELRDAAQQPALRMKLYVEFARARLVALEEMRADPKVKDRAQQTHDKLANFLAVYDELNDNIDTFVERKEDLRKPLKMVIEADNEFQAKLRALQSARDSNPGEAEHYQFVLDNAVETVDTSLQDHRQLLSEQEEAAKHKKK